MTALVGIGELLETPALFGRWFSGDSWAAWRAILKGAFGERLTSEEKQVYRELTERDPPGKKAHKVRELWIKAGRRCGKDSIASVIAVHAAAFTNYAAMLRPGERATVICLACDRDQSQLVMRYIRGYFAEVPALAAMVTRETADVIELDNRTEIIVGTNDFRAVRGRTVVCAIFDEVAFWRSEESASPDTEVYNAVVPSMATVPGAILVGISSPYRKAGLLYKKVRKHAGKDHDDTLARISHTGE
jgi:phage terminase large subunit-like protein